MRAAPCLSPTTSITPCCQQLSHVPSRPPDRPWTTCLCRPTTCSYQLLICAQQVSFRFNMSSASDQRSVRSSYCRHISWMTKKFRTSSPLALFERQLPMPTPTPHAHPRSLSCPAGMFILRPRKGTQFVASHQA